MYTCPLEEKIENDGNMKRRIWLFRYSFFFFSFSFSNTFSTKPLVIVPFLPFHLFLLFHILHFLFIHKREISTSFRSVFRYLVQVPSFLWCLLLLLFYIPYPSVPFLSHSTLISTFLSFSSFLSFPCKIPMWEQSSFRLYNFFALTFYFLRDFSTSCPSEHCCTFSLLLIIGTLL